LGKGRSKRGIFEGDLEEGELEIGQIAAMVNRSETAIEVVQDIVNEYFILKKYITL
jgi:enoyl-[acyl-carrier protein] reductase II